MATLSPYDDAIVEGLRAIVDPRGLTTSRSGMRRYLTGYRFGGGDAIAVVRPGDLVTLWRVLQYCVKADAAIILQAANTGLTGGSTPYGTNYDRPVIIVNMMRLRGIHPLAGGSQVLCLPGARLQELERLLAPLNREPHSVIGSSCVGASVIGGVCNSSGGALVSRGPAYTELALFARTGPDRTIELVNHLGIDLGSDPEEILRRLDNGDFGPVDIRYDVGAASDHDYGHRVRDIESDLPARYNADPNRLFEASGSAGKIAVFAVRLDSFPRPSTTTTFYIGTNDPADLTAIRTGMLGSAIPLPIAAEYIHRDAFRVARTYGRDTVRAIELLGTRRIPALFSLKSRLEALGSRLFAPDWTERLLQRVSRILPDHIPPRLRPFAERYEHHLLLKVPEDAVEATHRLLDRHLAAPMAAFILCTTKESDRAFLHRFAVASAAIRYKAVHQRRIDALVALDVAFPRNASAWRVPLTETEKAHIPLTLAYGHFFCHVFHLDYLIAKGSDAAICKQRLLATVRGMRGQYPAEHNVGHAYAATPALKAFYRSLDPANIFNPGIGDTSRNRNWERLGQKRPARID